MIQIRPGDLIAVKSDGLHVVFAVLTKQVLFGGHWSFVFHTPREAPPSSQDRVVGSGFNAVVDFIVPKREGRVVRVSRGNDFPSLFGPSLLQQAPLEGEPNYRIWRWKNRTREEAEFVRSTPTPTAEEYSAPHYACLRADFACDLAIRGWTYNMPMWSEHGVVPSAREAVAADSDTLPRGR